MALSNDDRPMRTWGGENGWLPNFRQFKSRPQTAPMYFENWMLDFQFSWYFHVMLPRTAHLCSIQALLDDSPVVALVGARQVGKTTLARELIRQHPAPTHLFDLESSTDLARLGDPMLALSELDGLVVLDEVQRRPDLFPTLRVLADRRPLPARFLVLGSASPDLLRQSSESLAGRIAYYELPVLSLAETRPERMDQLWLRGGFPASFTARSDAGSYRWRRDFVQTFLERDIGQLGIRIPAATLERFWSMLAHYHAQVWNGSELARAFGVSHHTVRRYLDALEATFMVRSLKPWSANLGKRQVRSPKVYVRDSGLLHRLLGIDSREQLERHPKVGAFVGRLRRRERDPGARGGEPTVLLLGRPFGRRNRPDREPRRPTSGSGGEAHQFAGRHAFHAQRR